MNLTIRSTLIFVITSTLLLSISFSTFELDSHSSVIKQAFARSNHHKSSHDHLGDVVPFANSLPSKKLCVTCASDKNIIRGEGLIVGTDHSDYIIGSTVNDIIFSKNGHDVVFADLGADSIYGSNGDDTVQAGPGNDQLLGENGNDNLFGGFDDDLIVGGPGNDHLFGDIGNDVLIGGPGANYFDCGDGIDTVLDFDPAKGDVMAGNCELF